MIKTKRIIQEQLGNIKDLKIKTIDMDTTQSNEVLIEVHCCGISFADILAYEGNYQDTPKVPFTAGLEVSGVVKDVGDNVKKFKNGDEVIALTLWGGFSEYVNVNEKFVLKKSKNIPHDIGSSMIINYGTALYTIFERLKCKKNDRVMILGASGGIGIASIELLKAIGCKVIAVASSKDKLDECSKYGADELILRKKNSNLKIELKSSLKENVDAVIDNIGGKDTLDSLSFLKWEGSIVPMGFASGKIAEIPANLVLLKNISIVGVFWGPFAKGNKSFNLNSISMINDFYDKKLIKISQPKLYDIENFMNAFDSIKKRESIGKVSLYTSKYSK